MKMHRTWRWVWVLPNWHTRTMGYHIWPKKNLRFDNDEKKKPIQKTAFCWSTWCGPNNCNLKSNTTRSCAWLKTNLMQTKKNCAVCLTFLWNSVPSKIQKSSRIIRWFGGLWCTTLVDFLSFSLLTPSLTVDEIILGCLHFNWLLFKNMGEMLISEIKQTKFGSANIHRIRWTVSIIRQTIYQSAYCSSSNEIDQTKQNKIVWLMWPKMHNIK